MTTSETSDAPRNTEQQLVGRWIAHWRYEDGSASGVLPRVLTNDEKSLLELAEEHFKGFGVTVKYVEANTDLRRGTPSPRNGSSTIKED